LSPTQISRYILSFSWIYHGFFPKLLHVAPIEKLMTASFGFSEKISYLITKSAGVGEILFGIILFLFYKNKIMVYLNILALIGLLFFVALLQPQLLIEAFNPVTTNLALIGLSIVLLHELNVKK